MNENKKIWIVLGILVIAILSMILLSIESGRQRQKIVDSFRGAYASSSENLVYLSRPGCSACTTFNPIFTKVIKDYKLTYVDINTDKITEKQLENIVEKLNLDWNQFGTPTIAVVKNNKVVKSNIGVISEEELIKFLKEANMIK